MTNMKTIFFQAGKIIVIQCEEIKNTKELPKDTRAIIKSLTTLLNSQVPQSHHLSITTFNHLYLPK